MSTSEGVLKAPFQWFGGKSKIANEVWRRFGDVPNYVEPFFGSGAVLLGRPPVDGNRTETVNDADGHLANFWRSVARDPEGVAYHADWPALELDLHARGDWLYYRPDTLDWIEQLRADPDYYDIKSAGWWVWFVSNWIGGLPSATESQIKGWKERLPDWVEPVDRTGMAKRKLPHLGDAGRGVMRTGMISRKLPHLGNAGMGVMRTGMISRRLPHLGTAGIGVMRKGMVKRRRPHLGDAGVVASRPRQDLYDYMGQLADRLRGVRVCCGDWSRVTGPAVTFKHGLTAVFLDPPYSGDERYDSLYSVDNHTVAAEVREWAIANGDNPLMRIALCGYDTEHNHAMPDGWHAYSWKAHGGYGNLGNGRGRANAAREVVWFSPHCINRPSDEPPSLFSNGSNK